MNYCSLHNHTEYSNLRGFLDAIVRPDELVNRAYELGFKGVAVTDHDVLSCHVDERLLNAVSKIKEQDETFKLILGNEIYLINEEDVQETKKFFHFILLAKDEIGHRQLRELSSRAWERSFVSSGITRTPTFYQDIEEIVRKEPGHLVASTACLGGQLGDLIAKKDGEQITQFINWCLSMFGEGNFFLEMQSAVNEEQKNANEYILKLSEFFDVPYIITDDTHYLVKEDFAIHSAYLNSRGSGDRETESFYSYTYLKSLEETKELLKDYLTEEQIEQGFRNSELIYNMIEDYSLLKPVMVPYREPPKFTLRHLFKDWYDKYEYIKKFAESEYLQDKYLLYLIENGFEIKKWTYDERHLSRINVELEQIWIISDKLNQRLSSYFELVREIVELSWQAGSTVGIARGSVSCFSICYLLDIIQINGLDYDLPYWRFLNKERVELPDIDMDFNPFLKDKIMEKVREHYGVENVLNTITYKTESTKSAILTSCRGLGIPSEEAQVLSSMVPMIRGKVLSLNSCLNGDDENEAVSGMQEALNKYPRLEETIRKIEGLISGRGVHASSVYIFNNGYLAQNSLMRAPNGTPITAFNMHQSDSMGALKMDFLYTEAQSKIGACLKLLLDDGLIQWKGSLFDTYNYYLHPDVLEYNNKEMWAQVGRNEIPDLFQFDTQVGLECAKKVKPENVNELTLANSVMRLMGDGGEKPIDRFVRFKNHIEDWYKEMEEYGLSAEEQEVLKNQLGESYGCSIEQERLMLLVMDEKISGLDLKWANKIRKAVAKKSKKVLVEVKDKFYENGIALGNSQKILDYVWKYGIGPQIGYSFARPHCLAYSLIALQEMNLATKYPNIYWASLFNC
ncbi:MAG: DNA polymerase III subunit alpha [Clostridia bacterium]|nr:DNA polymerase III subunit alpha [Clostridia bacterium]